MVKWMPPSIPSSSERKDLGANVLTVAVQTDNQVLLGGQFTRVNSVARNRAGQAECRGGSGFRLFPR